MEIKENEFVRTDNGIFKVTKIDGLYIYLDKQYFDNQYQTIRDVTFKERIVNHSFNIINLIEINDIVNESLVVDLYKILKDINKPEEGMTEIIYLENGQVINKSNEIKTILTHEQYERNCYKLEEE